MGVSTFLNSAQSSLGIQLGWRTNITSVIGLITVVALFTIGCMAHAGTFPGVTAGWVTLGLGGGSAVLAPLLPNGQLKDRKPQIICTLLCVLPLLITLGSLGVGGVLSGAQLGLALAILYGIGVGGIGCALLCGSCAFGRALAFQNTAS